MHGVQARRLLILAAATVAYAVAFLALFPVAGSVIAALSALPVIAVGWWYGLRAGFGAGLGAIAINAVLHTMVGDAWWVVLSARGITGSIVVVIVGVLVGHVQSTRSALARQLAARWAAETAASASASRARAILDAASEAVIVTDVTGAIVDANASAERTFERSRSALLGASLSDLVHSADPPTDAAEPAGSSALTSIATGVAAGGREFAAEVSTTTIDADLSAARVTSVRDISERVRDEQAARQAQKMEAIGQLAGGIAHDFNNLLTAISGYSDLLLLDEVSDQERRESAGEIRRAADRAASLTRQLLEFSRRQPVMRERLNLNDVVEGLDPMLRRLLGEHILVVTRLEPGLEDVSVDRAQMEQVLLNLAINARDAMEDGGVLTIATRGVEARHGRGTQEPEGRRVSLTVADTGCGMDPSVRARIFDPFYTTKAAGKGTGLGLSSAHGIIQSFEGEIRVESRVGQGSTFDVLLPIAEAAIRTDIDPITPTAEGGTERALLVEDEGPVRGLAGRYLIRHGYEVVLAASMRDALELAARDQRPFDILVTDVIMPGGNGPELAATLRRTHPGLPVLYLSGYPNLGEADGVVLDAPLLAKPFDGGGLARAVRRVLDAAGAPVAAASGTAPRP